MPIEHRFGASIVASSLLFLGLGAAVSAELQSLGDVARRESDRRREVAAAPGRVYTNQDLAAIEPPTEGPRQAVAALPHAQETATAPAAEAGPEEASTPEPQPTAEPNTQLPRERREEGYWRARAKDVRARLAKASADLESTQSSLSALDNGPKTPATARERAVVAAAMQRLQSNVRSRQLEEANLRTQAEINKIPAAWIK